MNTSHLTNDELEILRTPACGSCNHRQAMHTENDEYGGLDCIVVVKGERCGCCMPELGPRTRMQQMIADQPPRFSFMGSMA